MTEAEKELTPIEKYQLEYNQLCAEYGHNKAQVLVLEERQRTIEESMKKLRHKASNIPKGKQTEIDKNDE